MAWLGALVKGADGKPLQTTRAEQIEQDGGTITLPPLSMPYLLVFLQQVGMAMSGAMGAVALSSAELLAWSQGAGRKLTPWEFSTLLSASRAYCRQLSEDTDMPPYGDPRELSDPDVIGKRLSRALGNLARPVKRKRKQPA